MDPFRLDRTRESREMQRVGSRSTQCLSTDPSYLRIRPTPARCRQRLRSARERIAQPSRIPARSGGQHRPQDPPAASQEFALRRRLQLRSTDARRGRSPAPVDSAALTTVSWIAGRNVGSRSIGALPHCCIHSVFWDHLNRNLSRPLQVIGGSRRNVTIKDQSLGGSDLPSIPRSSSSIRLLLRSRNVWPVGAVSKMI